MVDLSRPKYRKGPLPAKLRDPLPQVILDNSMQRGRYTRMLPEVRKIRFPEIAGFFDPDALVSNDRPPDEMWAHALDVFGSDISWDRFDDSSSRPPDPTRIGWLKLRLHPWFKRWTLFQWGPDYRDGQMCWKPTYIAAQPAVDGVLPKDLDFPDGRFDDLKGKLGEYHAPTKEDFIDYKRVADRANFTSNWAQSRALMEDQTKRHKEAQRQVADYEQDFFDYYAALGHRDLNRQLGHWQSGLATMPVTSLDQIDKEVRERDYESEVRETPSGSTYKVYNRKIHPNPEVDGLLKDWEERMSEERRLSELAPEMTPETRAEVAAQVTARAKARRKQEFEEREAEIARLKRRNGGISDQSSDDLPQALAKERLRAMLAQRAKTRVL